MMIRALCTLILSAAVASSVAAQQNQQTIGGQSAVGGQTYSTSPSGNESRLNQHIASHLILANLKEQELSKYAKDKIDNDDVEEFAKKMEKEHGRLVSDLEQFAPHAASVKLADDGDSDSSTQSQQRTTASYGQDQVDRKLFTIQRRAAEKCVSLIKDELEEEEGDDLAQAYVGQQVAAHIGMLADLSAAERSASGELKEAVKDAKSRTEDHLSDAKDLMKKLKESN